MCSMISSASTMGLDQCIDVLTQDDPAPIQSFRGPLVRERRTIHPICEARMIKPKNIYNVNPLNTGNNLLSLVQSIYHGANLLSPADDKLALLQQIIQHLGFI